MDDPTIYIIKGALTGNPFVTSREIHPDAAPYVPLTDQIDPRLQAVGKAITDLAVAQALHSRKEWGEDIKTGPLTPLFELSERTVRASRPNEVEEIGEANLYGEMLRLVLDAARRSGVPYDAVISHGLKQLTQTGD